MLPEAQKNILIAWLNSLRDFQALISEKKADLTLIQAQWKKIQACLQSQIICIDCGDFPQNNASAWQTWQTETHRYARLLNTDLLFFFILPNKLV